MDLAIPSLPGQGPAALTATLTCGALARFLSAGGTVAKVARVEAHDALGQGFLTEVDAILDLVADPLRPDRTPAQRARRELPRAVIGQSASLALVPGPGSSLPRRCLGGCVTGVSFLGAVAIAGTSYQIVRFRLEPKLARWEHDRGNDMLAAVNPVEAIRTLLTRTGGPAFSDGSDFTLGFIDTKKHAARQQAVRWQESTAACVARLCEEEGIHSYYVHKQDDSGVHTLVFSEINQRKGDNAGTLAPFIQPVSDVTAAPLRRLHRQRLVAADGAESASTADRDCGRFSDKLDTCSTKLSHTTAPVDRAKALGDPPPTGIGRVRAASPCGSARIADGKDSDAIGTKGVGEAMAERLAEECAGRMRRLLARGDHIALQAGSVIAMRDGGDQDGDSFLVVGRRLRLLPALTRAAPMQGPVALPGAGGLAWMPAPELDELPGEGTTWTGYNLAADVLVEAIPLELPFRPARLRSAPVLAGLHYATVVTGDGKTTRTVTEKVDDPANPGQKKEEKVEKPCPGAIATDSLGRVRVIFDWAPGQPSGWIRVAQAARGLLALPRVGERVAVGFAYGDPERPLVAGVVLDKSSDLPGDPSSAEGGLGRTVLGGLWAGLEASHPANAALARAQDYAPANHWGKGFLSGASDAKANDVGSSYLAFDDEFEGKRGLDVFTSGMMREQVGGDRVIRIGHKLVIEAGGSIEFQVGDMNLAINRAGISLMYLGKYVPIKSEITLTPFDVTVQAPAVDITGTLHASLASACSSVTAHLTSVTTSAVQVSNDSGIGSLMGLLGTATQMAAQEIGDSIHELQTETPGDKMVLPKVKIGYFLAKEVLMQVKDISSLIGSAVSLGLSPIDIMGGGHSQCILGGSFMYATPFEGVGHLLKEAAPEAGASTVDALAEAGETIAVRATYDHEAFPSDRLEEAGSVNTPVVTGVEISEIAAGGVSTAVSVFEAGLSIYEAATSKLIANRIGVKGLSGVQILGTEANEVLLSHQTAEASNDRMQGLEDEMALKASNTDLQRTNRAIERGAQVVNDAGMAVARKLQQIDSQIEELSARTTGVSSSSTGVSATNTAASNRQSGALLMIGP